MQNKLGKGGLPTTHSFYQLCIAEEAVDAFDGMSGFVGCRHALESAAELSEADAYHAE